MCYSRKDDVVDLIVVFFFFSFWRQLKLAYQDNTPIQDANGVVIIKHGFSHNQDEYNRTEYPVPRNGILELNFYPPVDENVYTLGIEVFIAVVRCSLNLLRRTFSHFYSLFVAWL